ncbi:hypothetical protein GCM10019016_007430 [Streptomyces prasinosporus]|uniref:OsmC family peroxiredoxin n=1 Tax=Streptomyces prasinosporus TaxID=68256 RepID=A0ABP6TFP9_9ACTN
MTAEVGLGKQGEGFALAVTLRVELPDGLDEATGLKLVEQAHQVCPYSQRHPRQHPRRARRRVRPGRPRRGSPPDRASTSPVRRLHATTTASSGTRCRASAAASAPW